jgi:putative DNA methylase
MNVLSFIESQFPVSKLSKESYKERKANHGQTLTGLGKWWGRKPLVLVRATILGLLLPATSDPRRDREVFLKLMTMDDEGLWRRKRKNLSLSDAFDRLTPAERLQYFKTLALSGRQRLAPDASEVVQRIAFSRLTYDEKLTYCDRPEHGPGPSDDAWVEINTHLGTHATSLSALVRELGFRRWGREPRVGDAFCGGGSIPFEAARIGCRAYGSDLNPVAALLTWAALRVVGGGEELAAEVRQAQQAVYEAVAQQIAEWGIEQNEFGWRADAYLYCVEADCPECGVRVPLAPSWVVGERTKAVAILRRVENRFDIDINSGVSDAEMKRAKNSGTVRDYKLECPACNHVTPIEMIRGDRRSSEGWQFGLRMWQNGDLVPQPGDVFGERLYCIRWIETYMDDRGTQKTRRHYRAPDESDHLREARVVDLLCARFSSWQERGHIPSRQIEPGPETLKPVRTRGWTHWHHMYNPRQLLTLGSLSEAASQMLSGRSLQVRAAALVALGRGADWNSRACRWDASPANEKIAQVFSNQSLSPLFNYGTRPLAALDSTWNADLRVADVQPDSCVDLGDARAIEQTSDLWITDPPYADAISYDQLSEFFLAWYDGPLRHLFPDWYTDSKRALAVVGNDEDFRRSMVDCYSNLATHMPDDGMQVVMFTHQDAAVWADLALILWAAGLRVTAAWTLATETSSALKTGNYVQGTVLLVLRKQTGNQVAFLDEIYPEVQREVKRQLDEMLALDDDEDPNFGDTDYQLAAYAAALRVLTQYSRLGDLDLQRELSRPRRRGEVTAIEEVIATAVKIAADHLVPKGFDTFIWKTLTPEERFYLKGLDLESHGELRAGAYQELARGFGVRDYGELLESGRANETRVRTASGFGRRTLGGSGFGVSLVRNALFAVREAVSSDEPLKGRTWLQNEMPDYWNQRTALIEVLRYLARRGEQLDGWKEDSRVAALVAGAVENDHV